MKKFLTVLLFVTLVFSCTKKNHVQAQKELSVLVFITGVTAGSIPYEQMAQGALEFAGANSGVSVKIYEAGFNQAEWEQQLAEMVSSGVYDIVIGSNPSLPELCVNVGKKFPDQKFIITDAKYAGNPQIRTYLYNQYEQSLFLGYLAGLVTTSNMPYANKQKKIGFIAAQEYPLLTKQMVPGFLEGAKFVDKEIELDKRIIGSWADASKAAELCAAMIDSGVDVFTAIAGGAAQGMIKTAVEKNKYIVSYNANEYKLADGLVLGCGIMEQKKLVKEILEDALEGRIEYGIAQTVGVKEGYLGFIFDDPAYQKNMPVDIREKFEKFYNALSEGKINYTIPPL
ncbi:MAG: BMP family ABC transporter substrate-binding protein [Treponema sp.]|jgi:simple sugar transport system substrate-binding protein|nr:BMP family ABC transporter substrate-binding protein [Treponema sp.]